MGQAFPAGVGYEEGLRLLSFLSAHPSTARFISRKLATYFVCDDPPAPLVDRMAQAFLASDGNVADVLQTMVSAPEFWSAQSVRQKIKSPFEFVVSACRGVDANLSQTLPLFRVMDRMGQKLYHYQAPTGFPDKAAYWVNTGSLLNRMNFGLDLGSGRIRGVTWSMPVKREVTEPESVEAAMRSSFRQLLPERDPEPTVYRLQQAWDDPRWVSGVRKALSAAGVANADEEGVREKPLSETGTGPITDKHLSLILSMIIGSPEFQRR